MFYSTENVVDSMCFAIRIAAVTTDAALHRRFVLFVSAWCNVTETLFSLMSVSVLQIKVKVRAYLHQCSIVAFVASKYLS